MHTRHRVLAALALMAAAGAAQAQPAAKRTEWKVQGEPRITLAVRHVAAAKPGGLPIVLVHGARVPGVASFDLPVPGGSGYSAAVARQCSSAGRRAATGWATTPASTRIASPAS